MASPSEEQARVWQIYLDHRDLFAKALARTRPWPHDAGTDVVHEFLLRRLPQALRSFDPARGELRPWLFTVFIRYARRHKLEAQLLDGRWESLEALDLCEGVPLHRSGSDLARVRAALQQIDGPGREALMHFFSSARPSERSVAKLLGVTRYQARKLLTQSLAQVAARLEEPGVLDEHELAIVRDRFVRGLTISETAENAGCTEAAARAAEKRALEKLSSFVRSAKDVP